MINNKGKVNLLGLMEICMKVHSKTIKRLEKVISLGPVVIAMKVTGSMINRME